MTIIKFEGWSHELTDAEEWCRKCVAEGYYKERVGKGDYRFTFQCPFEAQRFLDRFHQKAWQNYQTRSHP